MSALEKPQASPILPMELTIEKAPFLRALSRLQSIVEKRNTIPILSHIKLEAQGGVLSLLATDMDIAALEKIPAKIEIDGAVTAPAHTLHDIIRKLPDGAEISLAVDEAKGQLKIQAGKSRFNLGCLAAADFPVMTEGDMPHSFSLKSEECVRLLDKARFAMSTEETRYYLNGVYLHVSKSSAFAKKKGDVLRTVATDGHRLASIEIELPKGAAGMPGIIVPRKTVSELRKLVEENADEVAISLSDSKIKFVCGSVTLISKLIDGTFPDYERVIPTKNEKAMDVATSVLTASVDRVATISTEKTRGIKFALENGQLTLSATSPENGSAREELEVTYNGDTIDIGFNSRYVLEMMAQFEGQNVQMLFHDSTSPALVRDPEDAGMLFVIMPMRI